MIQKVYLVSIGSNVHVTHLKRKLFFETTEKRSRCNPLPWDMVTVGCSSPQASYLGENGEMSWLSLAQVMMGGGELFTSQGRVTSSPARAAISTGLSWDSPLWSPNTLGLTKVDACFGREIVHWKHSIYNTMWTAKIPKSFTKKILLMSKVWGHVYNFPEMHGLS